MRLACAMLFATVFNATAAISISGLGDEQFYTDDVTFTIEAEAGFTFEADINGSAYGAPGEISLDVPGYYLLTVTKRDATTGDFVEDTTRQFLITASERGSSERGLYPWVPKRNVPSSTAEIDTGTLVVDAPSQYPAGWPLPVAAKLLDRSGKVLRVMAQVDMNGNPLPLFRGAGGFHHPPVTSAGDLTLDAKVGSLGLAPVVAIDSSPAWTDAPATVDVGAALSGFVRIPGDMTIASGVTLTIGAGSVLQIADGAEIRVDGVLRIEGTRSAPVTMTAAPGETWGGCIVDGEVHASYLFVTNGGGDDNWFDGTGYSTHRDEQATFLFDTGSTGTFADCFWIANPGQPLHNRSGTITLDRCLIQRSPTVGQFNGGAVSLRQCHLVEFPFDSAEFADDDNDGIYFTTGDHQLIDTVVGWAKDDGIDAGSGDDGTVFIDGCWFEACYHEGLALSGGGREVTIANTVAINNGQGIECGFSRSAGSPFVNVVNSVCIGNQVGWRYGDNYDWDYEGFLTVSGSIALDNDRDIWGMEWDSWTYRSDAMDIQGNKITIAAPLHPDNSAWDSANDGAGLEPFMVVPGMVGIGFGDPTMQRPLSCYGEPIEFGLSSFNSVPSGLRFEVAVKESGRPETVVASGGISIAAGFLSESYTPSPWDPEDPLEYVRVSISDPTGAEITTPRHLIYIDTPGAGGDETLLPFGSDWSYLDNGTDQRIAWRAPAFDDAAWPTGAAELGYGDGGEDTVLDDSPANYPTYYFRRRFEVDDPDRFAASTIRLLRDDGAVVYLNGDEVMRSNMDPGPVSHGDFAAGTVSSESTPVTQALDPSLLLPGENVFAVEVHQADATSSDVSFDLELTALPAVDPVLLLLPGGPGEALLVWSAPGGTVLERSTDFENWAALPSAESPMVIVPSDAGARAFYRLSDSQ